MLEEIKDEELEEVVILEVYTRGSKIGVNHPENGVIPMYKLIGFLECYVKDLKEVAISEWEHDDG